MVELPEDLSKLDNNGLPKFDSMTSSIMVQPEFRVGSLDRCRLGGKFQHYVHHSRPPRWESSTLLINFTFTPTASDTFQTI